jgi:aryl-alcohol dehydrogenase-like predicted oxidoreductase
MFVTAPGGTAELAGRTVARIGFGAMQLPGVRDRPAPPREVAVAVLRRAVELGVNHIDTAQFYGDGVANALIREALAPYPEQLVLVSKVGAAPGPDGGLVPAQRPEQLRAAVESNLTTLGVDRIDVINMRRLTGPPGLAAEGDQVVDLDSQLAELAALRDEGKIGAIGLSSVTLDQVRGALPVGITCVQNAYSLIQRDDEPLLELCREHQIAWVPYFPLGSAFSWLPKVTDHPAVLAAAATLGVTPAQIGLAWLLAHAPNTLLIPGTADPAHLADNVAAGSITLDADTLAALEA